MRPEQQYHETGCMHINLVLTCPPHKAQKGDGFFQLSIKIQKRNKNHAK
jgi:hypothetical protein